MGCQRIPLTMLQFESQVKPKMNQLEVVHGLPAGKRFEEATFFFNWFGERYRWSLMQVFENAIDEGLVMLDRVFNDLDQITRRKTITDSEPPDEELLEQLLLLIAEKEVVVARETAHERQPVPVRSLASTG